MRRIDAHSGRVVGRFSISPRRVIAVTDVVADAKQIWLVTGDNDLFRIDPRTKKIVSALHLTGGGKLSIVLTSDALWVAQAGSRRLTRIDTRTNVAARVPMRVKLTDRFSFPHLWDGGNRSLWLQPGPRSRIKLDPRTGTPLQTITLPLKSAHTIYSIGGIAVGFGSTWITQWPGRRNGLVFRLTP